MRDALSGILADEHARLSPQPSEPSPSCMTSRGAQYWYEALGLAVSEVAFQRVTNGKWRAEVPPFLDRDKIEALVQFHLHHVQDSLKSALGVRLMETDMLEQRRFLDDLAEKLRP